MSKSKLHTSACYNPYLIGNGVVDNIIFYDDSGVLAKTNKGWIGNNRTDIKEFGNLEFARRLKLNLDRKEHFHINSKKQESHRQNVQIDIYVYVPATDLIVTPLGEKVAMKTERSIHYGYFYELTATFNDGYDFSTDTLEKRELMQGTYSKVTNTPLGDQSVKLSEYLESIGLDNISSYGAEKMIANKAKIIKLLKG